MPRFFASSPDRLGPPRRRTPATALCALTISLLGLSSCSSSAPSAPSVDASGEFCGHTTCDGCCTTDGQCIAGSAHNACGQQGVQCVNCSLNGDICSEYQTCVPENPCLVNCAGCCMGQECLAGDTDQQCGASGAVCQSCGATHTCESQICVVRSCGPDNCGGCCDGNSCVPGTSNDSCGIEGSPCEDCGTDTCSGGICGVAGWLLFVQDATLAQDKPDGSNWDLGLFGAEKPDAKITFVVGSGADRIQKTTDKVTNTNEPVWDSYLSEGSTPIVFTLGQLLAHFELWLSDDDPGTPDDPMCDPTEVPITLANIESGFAIECGPNTLRFELRPEDALPVP